MMKFSRRRFAIALVVGILAVSACGGVEEDRGEGPTSSGESNGDGGVPSGVEGEGPETLENEDEPDAEQPRLVTPDINTFDEYVEMLVEKYQLENPPEVEVIREVDARDWSAVLGECLREYGFDAFGDGGGWGAHYPTDQAEAFDLASFECEMKYPLMPIFYRPYDTDILNRIYDYYEDTVMPCVVESGWDVAMVSRERFITRYEATRELATDFLDLPDAIAVKCDYNVPPEVILGE